MDAIVLAAGRSTRMGHPKALTRVGAVTALERIVDACRSLGLAVTVVAPHGVALPEVDARVVVNADPDAGRTRSLQLGLRGDALVWPVDHPLASVDTARRILARAGDWVVPTHEGRGGHPIVLRGAAVTAVERAPGSAALRDVLRGAGLDATRVPVDDAGILLNLDTPEALSGSSSMPAPGGTSTPP